MLMGAIPVKTRREEVSNLKTHMQGYIYRSIGGDIPNINQICNPIFGVIYWGIIHAVTVIYMYNRGAV